MHSYSIVDCNGKHIIAVSICTAHTKCRNGSMFRTNSNCFQRTSNLCREKTSNKKSLQTHTHTLENEVCIKSIPFFTNTSKTWRRIGMGRCAYSAREYYTGQSLLKLSTLCIQSIKLLVMALSNNFLLMFIVRCDDMPVENVIALCKHDNHNESALNKHWKLHLKTFFLNVLLALDLFFNQSVAMDREYRHGPFASE